MADTWARLCGRWPHAPEGSLLLTSGQGDVPLTNGTAFAELIPDPCQNIHQVNLLRRGYAHLTDNLSRLFLGSAKATRRTGTKSPTHV